MIQFDDNRPDRPGQAWRQAPMAEGRPADECRPATGRPAEGPGDDEAATFFVSPPPAPFPRIFPGL